jgi:hypothetical protein
MLNVVLQDLLEVVSPLLLSADFVTEESQAEATVDKLWKSLNDAGVGANSKPEVVLLKSAVLMGGYVTFCPFLVKHEMHLSLFF